MAKAVKKAKPRPKNYDPKLAINGSFADVIKVSMSGVDKPKRVAKKVTKKKGSN